MSDFVAALLMMMSGFLAVGFAFAAVRTRQTGVPHLLFWTNPINPQWQALLRNGFFQGTAAELGRILFFAIAALVAASSLFGTR